MLDATLQDVAEETFATLAYLMPLGEQERAQRDSAREFAAMNLRLLQEGREERILLAAAGTPLPFGDDAACGTACAVPSGMAPSAMASPNGLQRLSARVAFSGRFTGCIVLTIEEQLLEPLAANMLGMLGNSSTSQEQQFDALGELSNVICGNLLPKIATPQDVFKVHSPEVLSAGTATANCNGLRSQARVSLWLDGGRAELLLYTDHPVAMSADTTSAASILGS
ncbi:MAG: chemotaxis protein CheX [Planctomycetia bacterium]|nr:chemotaxis protein CheX [Planctomycetia bacterium]